MLTYPVDVRRDKVVNKFTADVDYGNQRDYSEMTVATVAVSWQDLLSSSQLEAFKVKFLHVLSIPGRTYVATGVAVADPCKTVFTLGKVSIQCMLAKQCAVPTAFQSY